MKLYHLSSTIKHKGKFEPRILPIRHSLGENDNLPRVPVSTSIEGCLTAIPTGGAALRRRVVNMHHPLFRVFEIDTNKLGIPEKAIYYPQALYQGDNVVDALFTQEHWITSPFTVPAEDSYVIHLHSWSELSNIVVAHYALTLVREQFHDNAAEAKRAKAKGVDAILVIQNAKWEVVSR
jgi:hypothetical protein